MELTDKMIEAGAEYLCGYSRDKAIKLEEEEKYYDCCRKAEEVFKLMQEAAASRPETTSDDFQRKLAEAEPVNDHPNLW